MSESVFPPEVPLIDDSVRITPIRADYVPRHYRYFCEESHVSSRFLAIDYAGRRYVEVHLSGGNIGKLRFNLENASWYIYFDEQHIQVEVEKVLG